MYGYSAWDRNQFLSQKFMALHQREAILRGPRDHVIVNDERLGEILPYLADYPLEVRSIPKEQLYISGDFYIYDDIYAMSLFEGERIVGIEIQNAEFVKVQKSIFENLWKSATKHA
jgi:hypothetical protein